MPNFPYHSSIHKKNHSFIEKSVKKKDSSDNQMKITTDDNNHDESKDAL